jgi:hypothetical protein
MSLFIYLKFGAKRTRSYFVSRANDELYKSGWNQGINPITSVYVVEMWNTIPNACLK